MAKTFYTSGTGSQQTLTGSQNEKVAVYQTLADAEADLANLEAGQIVATPDTGDENAQPVDVIQAGNMHAVTSNAVAQGLNSPFTRNIVINANANSILHIGSFTPAQANIIGASLEIQVKMYDSCYRTLATISYGNIRIGLLEGNETYCQLSLYKTSDTRYDLYLKTSSSQNCNAFIQITNPLNFTYDGSIVNDYSGTFVAPTYNNSINSVTANNMQSVTSSAVCEWVNPSDASYNNKNTQVFKINDIMWNNYTIIFFVGYIGNVGSVAGYVQRSDLTFRKFDGTDLGANKPTITLNTSTRELKITATAGGILLCALGAKHLRWE